MLFGRLVMSTLLNHIVYSSFKETDLVHKQHVQRCWFKLELYKFDTFTGCKGLKTSNLGQNHHLCY